MGNVQISEKDKDYVLDTPERGFSPARNRDIVEKVIKQNEDMQKVKAKEWKDGAEYRADAAASYLEHLDKGRYMKLNDYFGRELRDKIWGERFNAKLKLARAKYDKTGELPRILL